MKITKIPLKIKAVIEANQGFKSYLYNLYYKGRSATPASWFYEDKTPEELVKEVLNMTKKQFSDPVKQKLVDQIEEKNLKKFGPQGECPPFTTKEAKEVLDPIYKASKYDSISRLNGYQDKCKEFAEYCFGKSNLLSKRRKGFTSVIDDMTDRDTLSSNSGYPRFTRRAKVKDEEIRDAETGEWKGRPATLLYRHYHGKLRPVWMYPMSTNLKEYQFTQVIQDALRHSPNKAVRDHVTPWDGFEDVKRVITETWKPGLGRGGDTTKMDANMRRAQTQLVFNIVKWLFQKSEWDALYEIMMQVNSIDLLVGPNQIIKGLHGLASGSGWTQLLETILILFILWLNKQYVSQGIGDDFEFMGSLTAEQIVQMLAAFGLPANAEKQSVDDDDLDFLQRLFMRGFYSREDRKILGAYYSLIRALNSLKLPEKFHKPEDWNSDMYNSRVFMILENLVDDPAFEEFTKWAAHGQKDTIAFAKKTDRELQAIQAKSKLVPGLNPSYNQEKRRKPLSQFESIRVVRAM